MVKLLGLVNSVLGAIGCNQPGNLVENSVGKNRESEGGAGAATTSHSQTPPEHILAHQGLHGILLLFHSASIQP
jgi:hypothetical protein